MRIAAGLPALLALAVAGPAVTPRLAEPADGAVLSLSIPHLGWNQVFVPRPESMPEYVVQLSCDEHFAALEDEDQIAAVITRYVPSRELAPGAYWWRVAGVDARQNRGPWSLPRRFVIQPPQRVFTVPPGASHRQILDLLAQAAAAVPRCCAIRLHTGPRRARRCCSRPW